MSEGTETARRTPRRGPAERAEQARHLNKQRGLHVEPFGIGWRVHGSGIDLLTASFEWVGLLDLQPVR